MEDSNIAQKPEERKMEAKIEHQIEKREGRIMNFFKSKENLAIIIILVLAIVLRLYVLSLTSHQALWWDEADYMIKAKNVAFGTPMTGWNSAREVLAPYIWGIFLKISPTEFLPRLLQILISFGIVVLIYLFGKEAFNKRVGLIAAVLTAANSMFLFYSGRLLTYLWAPFFFLLFFYFFWRAYYQKDKKIYTYLAPITAAVGVAAYSSMVFGIAALALFLIFTEGFKFLKKKQIWLMMGVGIIALLPDLLYFYITKGDALIRWHTLAKTMTAADWSYFTGYFKLFPHYFGVLFTILIVLGFVYILFQVILSLDIVFKANDEEKGRNPKLLLLLWAIIVFGFYIYNAIVTKTVWETFPFSAFPALFLICGLFLDSFYKFLKSKNFVTILIIALLIFGVYFQASAGIVMVKNSVDSYSQLRDAGEWIKYNTPKNSTIYTTSSPQMTYYSERASVGIPYTPEEMNNLTIPPNSYFTFSVFERQSQLQWMQEYAQKNNLSGQVEFYMDAQKTQPAVVIFKLK